MCKKREGGGGARARCKIPHVIYRCYTCTAPILHAAWCAQCFPVTMHGARCAVCVPHQYRTANLDVMAWIRSVRDRVYITASIHQGLHYRQVLLECSDVQRCLTKPEKAGKDARERARATGAIIQAWSKSARALRCDLHGCRYRVG